MSRKEYRGYSKNGIREETKAPLGKLMAHVRDDGDLIRMEAIKLV